MSILRILSTGFVCLTFIGCTPTVIIPETDHPIEKLDWAEELYNRQERPVPAEKLIREAIEICEHDKDYSCLGKAYLNYGFFFRSPSINKQEDHYRENGFYDKTATFDNRLTKSKEYFELATAYYEKTKEYGALANAYLNLGFSYYFLSTSNLQASDNAEKKQSDKTAQCNAYIKSLGYNLKNLQDNPAARISLPAGISSFREYIEIQQKHAGCV